MVVAVPNHFRRRPRQSFGTCIARGFNGPLPVHHSRMSIGSKVVVFNDFCCKASFKVSPTPSCHVFGLLHPTTFVVLTSQSFSLFVPFSVVVDSAEETPPPSELLCLDVLHKSMDDGAVVTLTPCALGGDATSEDGSADEQKWEFSEVSYCRTVVW